MKGNLKLGSPTAPMVLDGHFSPCEKHPPEETKMQGVSFPVMGYRQSSFMKCTRMVCTLTVCGIRIKKKVDIF
jgi:hypothetical protein